MDEKQRLEKLDARQWIGVNKFIEGGANGTLEWATGVGKTHAFLKVYGRLRKRFPTEPINIVVPTDVLKSAWIKPGGHIDKHKLTNVSVYIINTFVKEVHQAILTVFDEVHTVLSQDAILFNQAIGLAESQFKLGLSGTLTPEEKAILASKRMPVVDTITFDEAVEEGFISPTIVFNLGVTFTKQEQEEYDRWDKMHNSHQRYFIGDEGWFDFKLAYACRTETDKCLMAAQKMGWTLEMGGEHEYSPKNIKKYANIYSLAVTNRTNVLYNAARKLEYTIRIIDKFSTLKTIVFSQRTAVVDALLKHYGKDVASVYHSNVKNQVISDGEVIATNVSMDEWKEILRVNPFARKVSAKKTKANALSAFEGGRTRILLTSQAMDAGYDLPEIELGVVHSGNSTKRQEGQRKGRAARYVLNKTAIIVNLYVKDTQEVKWLKGRQKNARNIYWIDNVDDIGTEPPKKADFYLNSKPPFQFGKINI